MFSYTRKSKFVISNVIVREFLSEFLGTFTLLVYGLSSLAQFSLGKTEYSSTLTLAWAWGMAIAMALYISGGVSGGHVNPAITVAFAVVGKFKWRKVPHYLLAQYLGSFLASAVVFMLYTDALDAFDGGLRQLSGPNGTAAIFATYPNPDVSIVSCLMDQVLGTFFLLLSISAIIDSRNCRIPGHLHPFLIGMFVFMHGTAMVYNCGGALNPARDLSPRIFTAVAGWGPEVFTAYNYFFWVPIVGPHLGGILGAVTYVGMIEHHWPSNGDKELMEVNVQPTFTKLHDPIVDEKGTTEKNCRDIDNLGCKKIRNNNKKSDCGKQGENCDTARKAETDKAKTFITPL